MTDQLRVKSFASASLASRYATAHGLASSGSIVVSFAPPLPASEREEYWAGGREIDRWKHVRTKWARRFGGLAAVAILAACSHSEPVTPNTAPVQAPARLNGVSAAQLIDAIVKAGLPAPNRRDTTAVKCPKVKCVQSIETDAVSITKFPATGPAQLYAAAISNVYQVEDVVLTFAPTVTAEQKQQYERVVERAAF